jgi:NTP pyrophosphatase (non-canonical NTP hydrolase)
MDFKTYQDGVIRTWRGDNPTLTRQQVMILFAQIGLSGETGELAEMIKKGIFHGQPELLDVEKVKKELGDILWYTTAMAHNFGLTLEDVAEANNRKLAARYPEGFVAGGGVRTGEGA